MLEMLKARKEALQERGVKGFTLMEMLIVIAIIAVLVAIAIPVLGAQLDRARATTDEANIRDGYAAMQVMILQPTNESGAAITTVADGTYNLQKDGTVKLSTWASQSLYECQGNSSALGTSVEVGGVAITGGWKSGQNITFTVTGGKLASIQATGGE